MRTPTSEIASTGVPTANDSQPRKGGTWLLEEAVAADVFTPERLTDEHRLMAKTTTEFVEAEVLPALDRLENKEWELARSLVRRCGELGLLSIAVPEEYGGLDLDKASSLAVAEQIGPSASFATTFGGQANLCILPLVLFGTPEQKQRYLPRLITGELIGAYALSEAGSGSDALAAKTRAAMKNDNRLYKSWRLLSGGAQKRGAYAWPDQVDEHNRERQDLKQRVPLQHDR